MTQGIKQVLAQMVKSMSRCLNQKATDFAIWDESVGRYTKAGCHSVETGISLADS